MNTMADASDYISEISISVISPVYNAERFIIESVESVFRQVGVSLELVCVDDGSTDASLAVLYELKETHPKLRVTTQVNSGAGIARNKGLSLAKGQYVIFLDPDDRFSSSTVLQSLLKAAEKTGRPLVAGTINYLVGRRAFPVAEYKIDQEGFVEAKDIKSCFGHTRFLFNRTFLHDNDLEYPSYRRFQDPPFLESAIWVAKGYYAIDCPVNDYRKAYKRERFTESKLVDYLCGVRDVLQMTSDHDQASAFRHTVGCLDYWPVLEACLNTDDGTALSLIEEIEGIVEGYAGRHVETRPLIARARNSGSFRTKAKVALKKSLYETKMKLFALCLRAPEERR